MSQSVPPTEEPRPGDPESQGSPHPPPESGGPSETAPDPSAEPAVEAPEPELLPFPVVAIGASAGGLEAITAILKNLPPDSGMAFVLLTHLAPGQKSHLVEILGPHTGMPVASVKHGVRPQANHVYVLPPHFYASLHDRRFVLKPRPERPLASMPIDHFFRALAAGQKNRSIGVVLSGADHDGALGLKAIKAEGGISIVQTPESSRHPGMPRASIAADHVDLVLPPEEIGAELARLGRQFTRPDVKLLEEAAFPPPAEGQHLARILTILSVASGTDFRQYKPATLQRRIARRMMLSRITSLQDYVRFLQARPDEVHDLQEDMLINVTHFFRDPDVFDALKTDILPRLLDNRPADQQLRIWIPGCSTGEEAYSIAICLLEYVGSGPEPPIQVFGTDASDRMVQAARIGLYPESVAADIAPERLRRFFITTDKGFQITKRVRDLCIFARQNLCNDPPFSRLDLISCRNVLIYFSQPLQKQIIQTFHYALRSDGFLLLGSSEMLRDHADLFTLLDRRRKFFMKLPSVRPVALEFPRQGPAPREPGEVAARGEGWTEAELQRAADRIVLARYGPAGVVVNERLEILQSRGHTGPYLEMSAGASSLNLFRMLRDSLAGDVRDAVQRAIAEDVPTQARVIGIMDGDRRHSVTVEVLPIQSANLHRRCYLVLFIPTPEPFSGAPGPQPAEALTADEKDRLISQLRRDLASNRLYLQSLIEERDVKNQDLISANEEVLSANEELQSANEELETTKEELQSANEELQTVNDELQQRNNALSQATNDLNNLLTSVNIPVLMLSQGLEIRQFTPAIQRVMSLRPTDVGRPVNEIRHNLAMDDLRPAVRDVLENLVARELEVRDAEGRWYQLRIRPYRTAENKIEGAVLVFVDIDQLRTAQEELRVSRDFAMAVIGSMHVPVAVLDMELRFRTANSAFRSLIGSGAHDVDRRPFGELAGVLLAAEPLRERLEQLRQSAVGEHPDLPSAFEVEFETAGRQPHVFWARGRSVQADVERVILLTLEDVTEQRQADRAQARERAALEQRIQSATQALDRSQEQTRALTASLFRSQEDERRWVARELHDDISQKLALIDMEIQEIEEGLPEDARAHIAEVRQETGALAADVRRLSHGLHPSALEDLGLAPALRALVEDFGKREEMLATFSAVDAPENLSLEAKAVLYRIAQEALHNVAKHAGKTHVKVILEAVDNHIRMEVSDLGQGFDPEEAHSGLGLISMAERARLIGGVLTVRSALGKGATIAVESPLS
ncbi:MAG: PAS domain-containing protein [Acidobacteriia bacterium]|nr:PAS domain-containing protein [Terriglobia bacterium]